MASSDKELTLKIKAETDKATKEIASLTKEVDKLSKEIGKSSKSTKSSTASFNSVGKAAGSLNKQLISLVATYASFSGAKALVQSSADIEEGFINVAKTTGLAGEEMDSFKEKLYDMSTSMAGVKLEGLQEIAESAGQLGISGTENILEFTRVITMMASTTELSAAEAASSMAQLGNSLGIPVESYEKLGSAINELSNTTTASAGDLINYSQRIAGMGKTFGLSAEEILAFAATLKDVGISAELGGTAVSKMMMQMLKDTEGFAKVAGVSLEEYSDLVKNEPVKAIQLFLDALGKLDKSAKIKALDDLKLKSSGTTQTMLKLSGATDKLTTALNTSKTAWEQNASLQKEYNTASEGFNAQMDRAENAVKVLAGRIGEELLPKLKELIDEFVNWISSLSTEEIKKYSEEVASLARTFGELIGTIGKFAVATAGFVADNGTVIVSIYALIKAVNLAKTAMFVFGTKGIGSVTTSAPAFTSAMGAMTTGLGLLWKGLNSVIMAAGPWGAAIAGIIAVTVGAVSAVDNYSEGLRKAADADVQSARDMDAHTNKIVSIGEAYQKADAEVEKHGNVTKKTRDTIEQALNSEIAAVEKQLAAWNKSGEMTKTQERNFFALAETLGTLKAKVDVLPTEYTLDMQAETLGFDNAIAGVKSETDTLTQAPHTVTVTADTSDADAKLNVLEEPLSTTLDVESNVEETKTETKELEKDLDSTLDIKSNSKEILRDTKELEKPINERHTVKSNVREVKNDLTALTKPTSSRHNIRDNSSSVQNDINRLKQPTYSVHTIYEKVVQTRATGGLVKQYLASGGVFTGSGAVAGYDATDSDKVNARLTGGEFVINRNSTDGIGRETLDFMNRMGRLPNYADGGSVPGSSDSPAIDTVVNLNIGGTKFKMMTDRAVAEAMERYLRSEGGV